MQKAFRNLLAVAAHNVAIILPRIQLKHPSTLLPILSGAHVAFLEQSLEYEAVHLTSQELDLCGWAICTPARQQLAACGSVPALSVGGPP